MTPFSLPSAYARIKRVHSFEELVTTPLAEGVNALCWERTLTGDFGEVVTLLGGGEGIRALDEARLRALPVSAAGRVACDELLADLRRLQEHALDPVLNCIDGYPRDEEPGPVVTDVFSFHADSAPIETTYLQCARGTDRGHGVCCLPSQCCVACARCALAASLSSASWHGSCGAAWQMLMRCIV